MRARVPLRQCGVRRAARERDARHAPAEIALALGLALALVLCGAPASLVAQDTWAVEVPVTAGPLTTTDGTRVLEALADAVAECAPGPGPYRLAYSVSVAPSGNVLSAAPDRSSGAELAPPRAVRCVRHLLEELVFPESDAVSRLEVEFAFGARSGSEAASAGPPAPGAPGTASVPGEEVAPSGDASAAGAGGREAVGSGAADTAVGADPGEAGEALGASETAEPDGEEHDWLDDVALRGHVDMYVAAHWPLPRPFESNQGLALQHRAYDLNGGVTLAFVGLDGSIAPRPIGATLRLRFGTAAPRLILNTVGIPGAEVLQFLYEAYVSWRPVEELQIDFGEFGTPYGAEVADSWLNPNYSRGSLYNVVQPFYHVGFRAALNPAPWITITLLAVNGWNNFIDNNDGKSGGIQFAFHAGPLNFSVGYMLGPEGATVTTAMDPTDLDDENSEMRHFADAVVTLDLGDFDLVANGDFYADNYVDMRGASLYDLLWGAMLGARYQIVPEFAVAARGEYIGDPDAAVLNGQRELVTLTGTLDLTPIEHLVVRLDARADIARLGGPADIMPTPRFTDIAGVVHDWVFSTILGVVVHTD